MIRDWKQLDAVHYSKITKRWILNYETSICNTICFLEKKRLYNIKAGYRVDGNGEIKNRIYERLYYKVTGDQDIVLVNKHYQLKVKEGKVVGEGSTYPVAQQVEDTIGNLSEYVKKVIIELARFNDMHQTDFYDEDIELLRSYLDKHDNAILDIQLNAETHE